MNGFYLMHRGWLANPAFGTAKREPFCRRSAWAWLIEHAAYQEHDIRVAGKPHHIARGQLSSSLRTLAAEWGWTEPKVRRYLRVLSEYSMIVCVSDAAHTTITICNYERYQDLASVGDAPADALATQQRRTGDAPKIIKNEGKEGKEGEEPPPMVPPQSSEGSANGTRRKPRRPFPPDWQPSEGGIAFALSKGRDMEWIDREGEKCRDNHISKGNVFADLDAAWRTWVRNADEFARYPQRVNGTGYAGQAQPGSFAAAAANVISRRGLG